MSPWGKMFLTLAGITADGRFDDDSYDLVNNVLKKTHQTGKRRMVYNHLYHIIDMSASRRP